MSLSERIRPNVEAAPWVIDEIKALEAQREALRAHTANLEQALLSKSMQAEEQQRKITALCAEVSAWRKRFPQYRYRPQDECVALEDKP